MVARNIEKGSGEMGRAVEAGMQVYGVFEPNEQWVHASTLKRSPWYEHEKNELKAYFAREGGGFARPVWYGVNESLEDTFAHSLPKIEHTWDLRWWSECDEHWGERRSGRISWFEHLQMRKTGALIGLGHFAIFDLRGPRALAVLDYLSMNRVNRPVGTVVYTQFLDQHGMIVSDLTITRLGTEHFRIVTGGADGNHDKEWIIAHLGCDENGEFCFDIEVEVDGSYACSQDVHFFDKTDEVFTLGFWGPIARAALSSLCDLDLSHANLPYMQGRPLHLNGAPAYARAMSYVGEDGCEIDVPASFAMHVWEALLQSEFRNKFGHIPAGIDVYATSAPLEGQYLLQGAEIDEWYNPAEAHLLRSRDKPTVFQGKEALRQHREQRMEGKLAARLCTLTAPMSHMKESSGLTRFLYGPGFPFVDLQTGACIVDRLGRRCFARRCGYGPSVALEIARGYLPPKYWTVGTQIGIEYMGEVYAFTVAGNDGTPIFDPEGKRLRGEYKE